MVASKKPKKKPVYRPTGGGTDALIDFLLTVDEDRGATNENEFLHVLVIDVVGVIFIVVIVFGSS